MQQWNQNLHRLRIRQVLRVDRQAAFVSQLDGSEQGGLFGAGDYTMHNASSASNDKTAATGQETTERQQSQDQRFKNHLIGDSDHGRLLGGRCLHGAWTVQSAFGRVTVCMEKQQ